MMEFQYNNHVHSSTQNTPFMLDTSHYPCMGFEPHSQAVMETANEFAERMHESLEEAKAALAKAKDDIITNTMTQLQSIRLEIRYIWMPLTLKLHDHPRNWHTVSLA